MRNANSPNRPPLPSPLLLLVSAVLLVSVLHAELFELLRYQRGAIYEGQLWRLFTAPLIHLGWPHTLMNLAGLALIWMLFGRFYSNWEWGFITLACALGVGAGLIALNPEIGWYVGLSGVLHGHFAAGAVAYRQRSSAASLLLLGLLAGKLFSEQYLGVLPANEVMAGGKVVVEAHLYGAIVGLVIGLLFNSRHVPDC